MRRLLAIAIFASTFFVAAYAAEVRVLSAGAVEPGIEAFAHQIKSETGHVLKIQFNTAPQIAARLAAGEVYDILISPPAAIDTAIQNGKAMAAGRVRVGKVGAGVHVRKGAPLPDVSTPEALKQAVLAADSVVYNNASTGLYLDKMFSAMGILDQIKAKTTRYANGASVLEHVIQGKGVEIGFGAITEIKLFEPKGLVYVGPLPEQVQNYTSYDAVQMLSGTSGIAAQAVLQAMQQASSKAIFAKAGVE